MRVSGSQFTRWQWKKGIRVKKYSFAERMARCDFRVENAHSATMCVIHHLSNENQDCGQLTCLSIYRTKCAYYVVHTVCLISICENVVKLFLCENLASIIIFVCELC